MLTFYNGKLLMLEAIELDKTNQVHKGTVNKFCMDITEGSTERKNRETLTSMQNSISGS